jgi:mRNA interferase RelE/StbE
MKTIYLPAALKVLRTIDKKDAASLRQKIEDFAADPTRPNSTAKAFGAGIGRVRHGDWRAAYRIDGASGTVTILSIKNRKEAYR